MTVNIAELDTIAHSLKEINANIHRGISIWTSLVLRRINACSKLDSEWGNYWGDDFFVEFKNIHYKENKIIRIFEKSFDETLKKISEFEKIIDELNPPKEFVKELNYTKKIFNFIEKSYHAIRIRLAEEEKIIKNKNGGFKKINDMFKKEFKLHKELYKVINKSKVSQTLAAFDKMSSYSGSVLIGTQLGALGGGFSGGMLYLMFLGMRGESNDVVFHATATTLTILGSIVGMIRMVRMASKRVHEINLKNIIKNTKKKRIS